MPKECVVYFLREYEAHFYGISWAESEAIYCGIVTTCWQYYPSKDRRDRTLLPQLMPEMAAHFGYNG